VKLPIDPRAQCRQSELYQPLLFFVDDIRKGK